MEVEKHNHELHSNSKNSTWFEEAEEVFIKAIDPAGWMFSELINQGVIKSLYEVDQYADKYPELKNVFKQTMDMFVANGQIKIENGLIIVLKPCVYYKFEMDTALSFLPDLARLAFRRVVEDYAKGTADDRNDFAEYIAFPDDPQVKVEVTRALNKCRKDLHEIQLKADKNVKNVKGIRLVNLSHGAFSMEGIV